MKYKILSAPAGRWGEGYQVGDIVAFDYEAAKVALENGEIVKVDEEISQEIIKEAKKQIEAFKELTEESGITSESLTCKKCGKICKSKFGLNAHIKSCK